MRLTNFIIVIVLSNVISAQTKTSLKADIDLLLRNSFFNSTAAAIDVYDLSDQEILYRKNEALLLQPASNLKLLTTSAALLFLGPEYNFETSVYYSGDIVDSVCYGNIYFVGGCDPDFSYNDLDSLTKEIKQFGIKEIKGSLYGDVSMLDSLFWGAGWMWDDENSMDFPYFTPLIVADACIKIEYSPGNIGESVNVNIIPETDYFNITNNSVTIEKDSSDFSIKRDWVNRNNNILVDGNLFVGTDKDTVKTNIVNPERFFMKLAEQCMHANGIKINGNTCIENLPANAEKIFTINRKFKDVLVNLNKKSDNLSAEMTLRAMAHKYFGKPAAAADGVKMIDSLITLVGLNPGDYRIMDGSGVSHYSLVTAELLTQILKHFYREYPDLYKLLYESLPVGGIDGTLKYRMKNESVYNNVHAKTGTLSGVSTLSGYLTSRNNHLIAFSILIQKYKGSSRTARGFQDEICKLLSELN